MDWTGQPWTPDCGRKAAHPNSRYTTPAKNCAIIDENWESPEGVPLSAIMFGGRRATVVPLVQEARTWQQGVFMGSCCASERTAAAEGKVGELRVDPFAMIPFCGYNMGDYFAHWLRMGEKLGERAPKIFFVNWFRKGADGSFLWPGFGENIRVIKWIMQRVDGTVGADESTCGLVPKPHDIDTEGLNVTPEVMKEIFSIDKEGMRSDLKRFTEFHSQFGTHLPEELIEERELLHMRLDN